jgi:hypothetical protein
MPDTYSVEELLGFLEHAAERGLMPAATAQALAVASRNVFGILSDQETADIRQLDLDAVVKRFHNKRARDFSTDTLKEYERRVRRAVKLFMEWREDPANFRAATRGTAPGRKRKGGPETISGGDAPTSSPAASLPASGMYQTVLPLGPGRFVTLANVPADLTSAEAERLAQFVRMLVVETAEESSGNRMRPDS